MTKLSPFYGAIRAIFGILGRFKGILRRQIGTDAASELLRFRRI
jgi:hypothetical protein